jgi:hypothetical protein
MFIEYFRHLENPSTKPSHASTFPHHGGPYAEAAQDRKIDGPDREYAGEIGEGGIPLNLTVCRAYYLSS